MKSFSGFPNAPTNGRSAAETQAYTGREKITIFASEWYFKPEGVRSVEEKFKYMLKQKNLVSLCAIS
jgi:hypothetical protein